MMKIETGEVLKNLAGEPMKLADGTEAKFGRTLANILVSARIEHKYSKHIYELSQKFFDDEVVELNKGEYQLLMGVLQADRTQNVMVVGQLMSKLEQESLYLDEPKNKKKKSKKK